MSGILWVASYPKSGSTWVRVVIANLFANPSRPFDINRLSQFDYGDALGHLYERVAGKSLEEMTDDELHALRPRVHRLIANERPETIFVKTHNAVTVLGDIPTVTSDVTEGAIYIVRNPFDLAVSYAPHYGLTIDQAVDAICSHENRVVTDKKVVMQFLGSWSDHVKSWTEAPGLRLHVVRYEDMSRKPVETFGRLVEFLGLPKDRERLKKAIRFSSFDVVSRQEEQTGFIERSSKADRFFRKGTVGEWRSVLTPALVDKLIDHHGDVMVEFGYLSKDGKVRA